MTKGGLRTSLGARAGVLLLLACPRIGWAHGEFPEATGVVFERDADPLPLVVTSFGILAPRRADDWTWVCEEVTGETSVTTFAALPSGRWFLGTFYGLWSSDDRCRWQVVPGDLEGRFVTQVQRDAVEPERVWAATSNGDMDNALWRSDDGGASFIAHATFGTGSAVRGFLQGSGGAPWYVFGWRDDLPWFWHSADGEVWTEHPIEALPQGNSVYPLGIDSRDPSRAYLEFHGYYGDSLVRVDPEGTLTVLLDLADDVTAFATGPSDGEIWAGGRNVGWYHSTDDGQSWDGPDPAPEAGCVVPHGDDWYLCHNNWADGAAVAVARAGTTEGEAVQVQLRPPAEKRRRDEDLANGQRGWRA